MGSDCGCGGARSHETSLDSIAGRASGLMNGKVLLMVRDTVVGRVMAARIGRHNLDGRIEMVASWYPMAITSATRLCRRRVEACMYLSHSSGNGNDPFEE